MSKPTTYFWKICKKSHGKRVIVSLVSNESLFFACHVSLLFNTQGSFVSKLQPIKTSHFWQGAWGRIGISEGFYFWAHEGASDVNGLIIQTTNQATAKLKSDLFIKTKRKFERQNTFWQTKYQTRLMFLSSPPTSFHLVCMIHALKAQQVNFF